MVSVQGLTGPLDGGPASPGLGISEPVALDLGLDDPAIAIEAPCHTDRAKHHSGSRGFIHYGHPHSD